MALSVTCATPSVAADGTPFTLNDQFSGKKLNAALWQFFPNKGCTRKTNAQVQGGYLHVRTSKKLCGVRLGNRQPFQYGTISARIKFDLAPGAHTGMTLYGTQGPWPSNGEVDVAEEIGRTPGVDHVRVWTQQVSSPTAKRCGTALDLPASVNQTWHTYGISWQPGSITFLLDGQVIWYWASWEAALKGCSYPFDDPGYTARIFFTSAVGGNYAGPPPPDRAGYPLDTLVDWVTVN